MTTPTTKTDTSAVMDLRALRRALDASARAKVDAEAREVEAERRTRQDGLLTYARRIVTDLKPAAEALHAGTARTPTMAPPVLLDRLGPRLHWAYNAAVEARGPLTRVVQVSDHVVALVKEMEGPTRLPPARLDALRVELDGAADLVPSLPALRAAGTRVRREAVALWAETRAAMAEYEAWWAPSPADLEAAAQYQQRLTDAAAAMPPIPPPVPRRGIPGANFDAVPPAPSRRPPLIENLEDL